MVRIASAFALFLSLSAVGLAIPFPRAVADVDADITAISTTVTTLDTDINAFDGTLAIALAIHNDAAACIAPLQTATTDILAIGTFSETDGAAVLASIEGIAPTFQDALSVIVTKKDNFTSLPVDGVPALILSDLTDLRSNTSALADALIATAPADLVAEATYIRDGILSAFDTAIAAYSS